MTALYIGGAAQGKRALARKNHPNAQTVDNLSERVRQILDTGGDPMALLAEVRGKIIVCDEVGCGIVPLGASDRAWREAVGRLCCEIAQEADLVVRVTAGIGVAIKGELP